MAYSRSADPSRPRVEYFIMQVEKGHINRKERERESQGLRVNVNTVLTHLVLNTAPRR